MTFCLSIRMHVPMSPARVFVTQEQLVSMGRHAAAGKGPNGVRSSTGARVSERAGRWLVGVLVVNSLGASVAGAVEAPSRGVRNAGRWPRRWSRSSWPTRKGMSVRILALGGVIQQLLAPDRNGKPADVVLGYATAQQYVDQPQYFGATVGRYANRIARRQVLAGRQAVPARDQRRPQPLARRQARVSTRCCGRSNRQRRFAGPRGAHSYECRWRRRLSRQAAGDPRPTRSNDKNELAIEYRATTDKPTIVNITNHSFFNLAGEATPTDVLGHRLTLFASKYTPVNATLIPTGDAPRCRRHRVRFPPSRTPSASAFATVATSSCALRVATITTSHHRRRAPGQLRLAARVEEPQSGRVLELLASAPGVQFYSGQFPRCHQHRQEQARLSAGRCVSACEPRVFPDSPNHSDFPSARLNPGRDVREHHGAAFLRRSPKLSNLTRNPMSPSDSQFARTRVACARAPGSTIPPMRT